MIRMVALAAGLAGSGFAYGQAGGSPCAAMKDRVGCACALATGGTASGQTWARGPDRAAFTACLAAQGAPAPARPASIPARR